MWRVLLVLVFMPALALAQQAPIIPDENIPLECLITPTLPGASGSYPGHERIQPSNKVAMAPGKAVYARGEVLYLQGRVLDEDCVPIPDVSLELWQTDTTGKYRWETQGKLLSPEPAFAGTGHATTNNQGEYEFLTVFPGAYGNRGPHIHLRVTHEKFEPLTTEVFFDGDRRNYGDHRLNALPSRMRDRLMAKVTLPNYQGPDSGLLARFDIVLQGKNKVKHY